MRDRWPVESAEAPVDNCIIPDADEPEFPVPSRIAPDCASLSADSRCTIPLVPTALAAVFADILPPVC